MQNQLEVSASVPSPSADSSATSWTLVISSRLRAWTAYRPFKFALALVVLLAVGWLLVGRLSNGMPSQMVVNDGYQYHFKFYTHAVPISIEGTTVLATKQGIYALGEPTKSSPVSDCADMGRSWSQAFVATIAGSTRPVCSRADGDTYMYTAYFSTDGATHAFTVTYSISVTQAAKRAPDTAKLQAIFNSVRVTPQPQN